MQDVIHQPHEGCRRICQSERHDETLQKALLGFEGSLPHIRGFDWYLVIPIFQVDLTEIFFPFELVQKVINLWDWVPIPDNDIVQCLIINIESPSPILLLYQHDQAPKG